MKSAGTIQTKMKKNIFDPLKYLSISALLIAAAGYGQEKKSDVSVYAGGLLSYIDHSLEQGSIEKGNGGMVGLRYSYYLDSNWSVGAGVEYQSYNDTSGFSNLSGEYSTTDIEDESFDFRYSADDLNEEHKLRYLNIPITVQYETSGLTRFYVSAGAKIGFALSATYETTISELNTSGYYPQYDAELFGPEFMGFGALGRIESGRQDLETKMAFSGTFETGIKQLTGSNSSIYIGLFMDYGLNNIYEKKGTRQIIEYTREAPVNMQYNTVLDSGSAGDARLVAYGFKIRVGVL